MERPLQEALASALGASVTSAHSVTGGDVNDCYRVELGDGRVVFVKTRRDAPDTMYLREAEGLAWLGQAGALRVPRVLYACARFLALEHLPSGPRTADFDSRLGEGLAALHAEHPSRFGWEADNFIGPLPQPNGPCESWPTFYRERRLRPMLARVQRRGLGDRQLARQFDELFATLDERCGTSEPPARLHGDLWSGNVFVDEQGGPCLIDPAVYGGHREVDLAMLQLFGSPSERFFDAYQATYPLSAGWRERVALYQLYPLLVHVCLFGGAYLGQLADALRRSLR